MGACITPFYKKDDMQKSMAFPCGKCPQCLKRRVSAWSFRLMQEESVSKSANFITLTYDTLHIPITERGFLNLCKRDVQLFFKRLRKSHSSNGESAVIKYYCVGEYGGRTKRPHYHILIFNAKLELIQPAWNLGAIHYGTVTGASVGYCLKYMTKTKKIPMHKNDDRTPEFSLMSKGIGESYLNDTMVRWHHKDKNNRMYCNLLDGKKIAMPRYYKNKIYTDEERKQIGYHTRAAMVKRERELMEKIGEDYFYNLAISHENQFKIMNQKALQGRDKV